MTDAVELIHYGVDDNKNAVAFSWKVRREIKRNTRNGEYTSSNGLIGTGVVLLPDANTKTAMNNSLANTRTDTKSDADAHEEGGFSDNTGPHEAKPGAGIGHDPNLPPDAAAGIDFSDAKDVTIFNPLNVSFIWHTHPIGTESVQADTENPSDLEGGSGDIPVVRSYPNSTHIIISSYSENLIFYNGKGIYLVMKIKIFYAVIDEKSNSRKEKFEKKRNETQERKNSEFIDPVEIEFGF